jgi:hypothetical protein
LELNNFVALLQRFGDSVRKVFAGIVALVVGGSVLGAAAPAEATIARSGPGAAAIVQTFRAAANDWGQYLIRSGNASFGLAHIAQGGTSKNTASHPTDGAARQIWQSAILSSNYSVPFHGGLLFT